MRVHSWAARIAVAATTGLLGLALAAASAQAATTGKHHAPPTLWVSATGPTVPGYGTSCTKPGFTSIQGAVTTAPAGATVKVCHGTYAEQVQITKSLTVTGTGGKVTLTLPAVPVYATACNRTASSIYGVDVCGAVRVTLSHLTVDSSLPAACNDDLNAVSVDSGAALLFLDSAVTGAGSTSSGCQGGIGILVTNAHLAAVNDSVSGYQKNGITVKNTVPNGGSTAYISHVSVTGFGPSPYIAQNGIEIADGAAGYITGSTVRGNECSDMPAGCGPDGLNDTQSTGVMFYDAAKGSQLTHSTVTGNDIGVYFLAPTDGPLGAVLSHDQLRGNRYEDACLDQGRVEIDHSLLAGGNVALQLLQYSGQTAGLDVTASHDAIGPAAVHAVQVYSDQSGSDLPGKLVISHSVIKGSVANNSPAAARVKISVH